MFEKRFILILNLASISFYTANPDWALSFTTLMCKQMVLLNLGFWSSLKLIFFRLSFSRKMKKYLKIGKPPQPILHRFLYLILFLYSFTIKVLF